MSHLRHSPVAWDGWQIHNHATPWRRCLRTSSAANLSNPDRLFSHTDMVVSGVAFDSGRANPPVPTCGYDVPARRPCWRFKMDSSAIRDQFAAPAVAGMGARDSRPVHLSLRLLLCHSE